MSVLPQEATIATFLSKFSFMMQNITKNIVVELIEQEVQLATERHEYIKLNKNVAYK